MSLLADLLARIKQPQAKREIPPNLKDIVQSSSNKSSSKRKMVILSSILILFVVTGIAALLFVKQLEQSSDSSIAGPSTAGSPEPVIREVVRSVKPEIKTAQTGQPKKEDKINLPKGGDLLPETGKVNKETASEDTKKSFSKSPRVVPPPFVRAARPGAPASGAWGKGSADKKSEKSEEPPVKTNIQSAPKKANGSKTRDFHLYSARSHELNADYVKALADYKKALKADSENITIINSIAYVYLQLGIHDASISYSQKAIDINEEYVPALTNMGIALAKQNRPQEAEEYFRSALSVEPENPNVLLNLALLLEKQETYESAADYYGRLKRLGNIKGMFGLARIYERLGDTDRAVEHYKSIYVHDGIDEKTKIKVRQRIMQLKNH